MHLGMAYAESSEEITMTYTLTRLILTSLPDLRLEPTLDCINTPSATTRFARHEEDTILLRK